METYLEVGLMSEELWVGASVYQMKNGLSRHSHDDNGRIYSMCGDIINVLRP